MLEALGEEVLKRQLEGAKSEVEATINEFLIIVLKLRNTQMLRNTMSHVRPTKKHQTQVFRDW